MRPMKYVPMHILRAPVTLLAMFAIVFTASVFTAYGHGAGASFEQIENGYLIDIGYSPEEIEAGTSVRLDFNIFEEASGSPVPFSDVWLRITKEEQTLFAGGIQRADFGGTGVMYTPPDAGVYTISARFQNNGEALAEAEFPLDVQPSDETANPIPLAWGLLGLIVGGVGTFLVIRNRT